MRVVFVKSAYDIAKDHDLDTINATYSHPPYYKQMLTIMEVPFLVVWTGERQVNSHELLLHVGAFTNQGPSYTM